MRLADILDEQILGAARVAAGGAGLQRTVGWAHVVDLPDPGPWIQRDQLLLTTGVAWSREPGELQRMVRDLDSRGVAGLGLAVPHYHVAAPEAVVREADRLGLPLVEIPWELPFTEITARLHRRILEEQQHIQAQAATVHRALTRAAIEAESLGEIIAVFSRLIRRAVMLEDPEARVIASYHDGADLDRVRQVSIDRGMASAEVQRTLHSHGYYSHITSSQEAVRIPAIPSLGMSSRVACAVWLKSELEGVVWILEGDQPLGEIDMRAAEHAATIVALHIARERTVASVEQRLGHSLVELLVEGQFTVSPTSLERATLLGFDPAMPHRVTIITLDQSAPLAPDAYLKRERLRARLIHRLAARGEPTLIASTGNELLLLSRETVDIPSLWAEVSIDDASVYIGRCHAGVDGVRQSYQEARSLRRWSPGERLVTYEASLLPRLLMGDREARDAFTVDLLGRFDGMLHAEMYIHTLRTLACHGFHQARAADALVIHPKTMQHRVNRLSEVLCLDLEDPDARFHIQLAFRLMDLA